MAYSGNSIFLSVDGVDISSHWVDVELTPSQEEADTTHGSGVTHRTRNVGLKDHKIKITVAYDETAIQTVLAAVKVGQHTIIYGPEGNGTGKPKHQQVFNFMSAPHKIDAEKKNLIVFTVDGNAAAAPVYDMYGTDTF